MGGKYLNPRIKRINPAKVAYNNSIKNGTSSNKIQYSGKQHPGGDVRN